MIDLDRRYIQQLLKILDEQAPEYEVWAYGSRVSGGAWKFSDLDLVLIGDVPIDWRRLESLKEAFSESDLPIAVDVLDWRSISDSFQAIISENHEILRERKA